ncbi:MAG: (Fe-S)-binding protein [Nitrospinales bacterium]
MKIYSIGGIPQEYMPFTLGFLTLASIFAFFVALWPKLKILLIASPDNRFDNPLIRLKNTLFIAFGQIRLFKDSKAGWMHAIIFWGFLILLLRAIQFFLMGFFPNEQLNLHFNMPLENFYNFIKDGFVFFVTIACIYGLYRRLVLKPQRLTLSFEAILILLLILSIMVSDIFFEAANHSLHPEISSGWSPLGYIFSAVALQSLSPQILVSIMGGAYWTHIIAILVFVNLLPRSKHFHVITSIPNVYFSNIGIKGSALRKIDFEDEEQETFGVTRIEEFTWKGLFDLHTCTECGRCDDVCPALASGKPLSPKQFNIDLRNHLNAQTTSLVGKSKISSGVETPQLVGNTILDETIWSCTTCGACEEACPVTIEFVNKMIDLRRGTVMMESSHPQELTSAFKSLEVHQNPWGFSRDSRADWAADLDLKIWDKENPTEYLYFVGCSGSFDSRGKQISTAVVNVLRKAGVDFSILGKEEGCTGDPARRAGNEYLFDMLASKNVEMFNEKGIQKIIAHCPHCFNSLKNEYPEFGATLEVIHHSELLEQLMREGKLSAGEKSQDDVVYHDSCYMGRHNDVYDAPREILSRKLGGESAKEPENTRKNGACCGAGGARFLVEENTGTKMSHNRIDELMKTNPKTIAVSCPFCVLMLEDALKAKNLSEKVKVLDVSEMLQS